MAGRRVKMLLFCTEFTLKLRRCGPPGAGKPGLIDASDDLRDLSGVVEDSSPTTLAPDSMSRPRRWMPAAGRV